MINSNVYISQICFSINDYLGLDSKMFYIPFQWAVLELSHVS